MDFVCIIPARISSSRFPGKVIYPILGKPMIGWVISACLKATSKVFVASDSEKVLEIAESFKARGIFIKDDVSSGTERVALCVKRLKIKEDVIVNVQADEPLITPEIIKGTVKLLKKFKISTYAFYSEDEFSNPNRVKVVVGKDKSALYFSRSPIPYNAKRFLIHGGIYAFRRETLLKFIKLSSTLQEIENLEQLRALENGIKIGVFIGEKKLFPVDTPEDIEKVESQLLSLNSYEF